ncbi:IPT/TIG domain-containing protein [Hymenobacter sp. 5317J-9]|uniref:RCC1-like domain-containing protein n=1 Tax=Hymenobacter sp. 5317J-9 TaxID=2932250 RepID=UPI001FD701D9|nr:RCC1 domain-containing protein [Hymenobacter sp. 5317J-9]UOQ98329.1 IPT/TIG domain-containing protein [Hymenobacter sp. 5317J-9]
MSHAVLAQPENVAVGNGHLLAIHADGTLWGSGFNGDGRLGDGTTTARPRPVQIGTATTWRTVSTGGGQGQLDSQFDPDYAFVVALQTDGSMWSWGSFSGYLGYNLSPLANVLSPRLVSAGPWVCASAGFNHSAAVRADGTLWTWGNNTLGQLGNGSIGIATSLTTPTQVGTDTDWASVSAGRYYTVALKTNGTLWSWGSGLSVGIPNSPDLVRPTQVGTASNWTRICAGLFSLALRADGTLWGWGIDSYNHLFRSVTTNQNLGPPTQLGTGTTWSRIACGDDHALAIKTDGTLWGWGFNLEGMVGNGTRVDAVAPVQVGAATTWERVAAGGYTSATTQADGSLWAWGDSKAGQTGDPSRTFGRLPVPVQVDSTTTWATPATNPRAALGLRTDGALWTWGDDFSAGLLGDGPVAYRQTMARIDSPATYIRLSGNERHTLALRADSTLWAWGDNQFGQLGDGTTTARLAPVAISFSRWKRIAAGGNGSLAIRADGTLWAWGDNAYGQLGDGTTTRRLSPVQVGTGHDWAQVVSLTYCTLALRTDGTLWAWGEPGMFGNGSTSTVNQLTPLRVGAVTTWTQLSASETHVLALRTDGSLWAWGNNGFGQLGTSGGFRSSPVRIGTATDWASVIASIDGEFSLALKSNGTLWTWGNNSHGQLGRPATSPPVPTQLGNATWAAAAAGATYTLAVRADGTLWEWGDNRQGQSGLPSFSLRPGSVQTNLRPVMPFAFNSFSPGAGVVGATVTLTGVGLGAVQAVAFGGVSAPGFTVNAGGTVLTVAVPIGAHSGAIAVLGPDGTAWGASPFQVLAAPVISSFAPGTAAPGTTITITGTGLLGATSVLLGSMPVTGFVVNAAGTSLTFVVPASSTGGFISVSNSIGTATTATPLAIVLATAVSAPSAPITIAPIPVQVGQPVRLGNLPVGAVTVVIISSVGQRVGSVAWPTTHSAEEVLDWLPTNPGLYMLSLQTQAQVITRRVLVE